MRDKKGRRLGIFTIILLSVGVISPAISHEGAEIPKNGLNKKLTSIFDMKKSIEMTQPRYVETTSLNIEPDIASYSPDGENFVILTSKANINSNSSKYTLWLYKISDIKSEMIRNGNLDGIKGEPIVEINSDDFAFIYEGHHPSPIRRLKWLDGGKQLAFVAAKKGDSGDVYLYNILEKKLRRLTNSPGSVEDYSISLQSDTIIYLARNIRTCPTAFPYPEKVGNFAFPVHIGMCNHPGLAQRFPYQRFQIYKAGLATFAQQPGKAISGEFTWVPAMPRLTLSPDGRWATVIAAPHSKAPAHWEYFFKRIGQSDFWSEVAGRRDDDGVVGQGLSMAGQFLIVDVEKGKTRPVFDAPVAYLGFYASGHWLRDGKTVILTHTFIPRGGGASDYYKKLHIVELNVETGKYRVIYSFNDPIMDMESNKTIYTNTYLGPDGVLFLEVRRGKIDLSNASILPEETSIVALARSDHGWVVKGEGKSVEEISRHRQIDIILRQNMNTPPDYYVKYAINGSEYRLTGLNPHLRYVEMPEVKVIHWNTTDGANWKGGLIFPPGFRKDYRYPLVIQVHCFDERVYLRDSSNNEETAPFAGRALAAQGVVVLQMSPMSSGSANEAAQQGPEANDGFTTAVKTIIDQLSEQGIVNSDRIGMVGWSAGGRAVLSALTSGKFKLRAAVIADAAPVGPLAYFLSAGWPKNMAAWIEAQVGGHPWGDGLIKWIEGNPVYKLDKITAAIRLEAYDRIGAVAWYDVFTIMKRLGKPVEFYVYDGASHAPQNPQQRYTSSQGTVDWMLFLA